MDKKESRIWNDGFDRGIKIFAVNLKRDTKLLKPDIETDSIDLDILDKLIDKLKEQLKNDKNKN